MAETRTPRRWGKAGIRLDADGRPDDSRTRQLRAEANRARLAREQSDRIAYQRWRDGLVVPHRITLALDIHMLDGPEVDIACKAREPEVDQWEAGERYPSWEQLCALAELTCVTPGFFTAHGIEPLALWQTSMWHKMSAPERRAYEKSWKPPVMRYPRAVLAERPPAPADMPADDTREGTT